VVKVVGDYAWEQGRQRFGVKENLDDFQEKKYGWQVELMRFIEKTVASRADKIIVPSNYLKKIIIKWGMEGNKISVIYNVVRNIDLKIRKEEARSELNLGGGKIILTSGRLVPWKGFDALIELMPELIKINSDYKLILVGSGPDEKRLLGIIENKGLQNGVKIITGKIQAEVLKYMRASDLFILNSGYEGLSHVLIEAKQVGVPVAASNIGGNPEVIKDNFDGILFEYNDRERIKKAIIDLTTNKSMVEEFMSNGLNNLKKFKQDNMINSLISLISGI